MLRRMLLPLDGSTASDSAVRLAIDMAKRYDVHLTGMGILDAPGITAPAAAPIGGDSFKGPRDEALLRDAHSQIERFLAAFEDKCNDAAVSCQSIETEGVPFQMVCEQAHMHDLVVLARDANFHFETAVRDSDTLKHLLAETTRPLLVVPPGDCRGGSVIVAYDGSPQASRALHLFVLLGLHRHKDVHVVSVFGKREQAAMACSGVTQFLNAHGARGDCRPIASRAVPAEVVLSEIESAGADMLVAGASGLSGLRAWFGSFCQHMLQHCPVPMFVHH